VAEESESEKKVKGNRKQKVNEKKQIHLEY
jgi:hypothetical protein